MRFRTRNVVSLSGFGIAAYLGVLIAVVAIAGIAAVLWWLGVADSGARGAGDVRKDQNNAANREQWSATFNTEYRQIQTDQANLLTLKSAATGAGATQQDRMNYEGAQLNCRQDVAEYNADAASILGHPWLPAGLSAAINPSDYCGN